MKSYFIVPSGLKITFPKKTCFRKKFSCYYLPRFHKFFYKNNLGCSYVVGGLLTSKVNERIIIALQVNRDKYCLRQ